MENLSVEIKTGGAYGDHIFISCAVSLEMEIDGVEYYGSFQTGHSYDHNDYNYPSNSVSVYDDNEILTALDCSSGDYDEFIVHSSVKVTEKDFYRAYSELEELRDTAQAEVDKALAEAKEELQRDKNTYILITEREREDETGEYIQCSPQYSCRFEDSVDAKVYIEEQQELGNLAHATTVEQGIASHVEPFSNW